MKTSDLIHQLRSLTFSGSPGETSELFISTPAPVIIQEELNLKSTPPPFVTPQPLKDVDTDVFGSYKVPSFKEEPKESDTTILEEHPRSDSNANKKSSPSLN